MIFLLGNSKIIIGQDKIEEFCIWNTVTSEINSFKCSIFDFELNQNCLTDPHFKYSKAYDESMQILFLKGEQTSVNIQNKNLKNMITIKIDKVPLIKIIMNSLYSHEGRNLINENILPYSIFSSPPKRPTFSKIREGNRQRWFFIFKNFPKFFKIFLPKEQ